VRIIRKTNGIEVVPDCKRCSQRGYVFPVNLDGFRDHYLITSTGRVWSVRREIWLSDKSTHPYARVLLCENGRKKSTVVHRLVAATFPSMIPDWTGVPITDEHEIDHYDRDKRHNCAENLRVMAEGQTKLGYQKGERKSKLRAHANQVREMLKQGDKPKEIARRFGVSVTAIYNLRSGKSHADV
jgi:hypothetical protein